jgi:hypothetical protein
MLKQIFFSKYNLMCKGAAYLGAPFLPAVDRTICVA